MFETAVTPCQVTTGNICKRPCHRTGFFGHGFLHSTFAADYQLGTAKTKVFIIEATEARAAAAMLASYIALAEKKGLTATKTADSVRFEDPYRRSLGPVNVRTSGRYLWGIFTTNTDLAAKYLGESKPASGASS